MKIITKAGAALAALLVAAAPYTAFASEETTENIWEDDEYSAEELATEGSEIQSGDFTYVVNTPDDDYYIESMYEENTARICSYTGEETDIVVPEEIDGYKVTTLAEFCFSSSDYTSVELPATLNFFGYGALYNNPDLTEIKIADGNEDFVFEDGCLYSSDKSVLYMRLMSEEEGSFTVPEEVTEIWGSAFCDTALTDIKLPSGLVSIDEWAFANCPRLTEIKIPATVTTIGDYAFAYCGGLYKVDFEDGSELDTIEEAAFAGCKALEDISLPASLSTIKQHAFSDTGLSSIYIPASVSAIGYCAFGYYFDENNEPQAINDFTIYGPAGGAGETYATEEDEENEYKNNFTFISDDDKLKNEAAAQENAQSKKTVNVKKVVAYSLLGAAAGGILVVLLLLIFGGKKKK